MTGRFQRLVQVVKLPRLVAVGMRGDCSLSAVKCTFLTPCSSSSLLSGI